MYSPQQGEVGFMAKKKGYPFETLRKKRGITYTFLTEEATPEEVDSVPSGRNNIQFNTRLTKEISLSLHDYCVKNGLNVCDVVRSAIENEASGSHNISKDSIPKTVIAEIFIALTQFATWEEGLDFIEQKLRELV